MGGRVGFESEEGVGSTFWFTIRAGKQTVQPQWRMTAPVAFHDLHVLVVDDNATNRHILEHHLERWGCFVTSAPGGHEALLALREAAVSPRRFALAIIDMHMPGMDGEALAGRLRDDPHLRDTRVVMLTSVHQVRDAKRIKAQGIDGYLNKPLKPRQLYDCIAMVMGTPSRNDPDAPAMAFTEETVDAASNLGPARVLVVEDNEVNQRVAQAMLARRGIRCHVARHGREAVELHAARAWDVIFMDCQMPVMDGFEATRLIREAEAGADRRTPIVAMTANAMRSDEQRCREAGMDDHLAKPVQDGELVACLRRWLASAAAPPLDDAGA